MAWQVVHQFGVKLHRGGFAVGLSNFVRVLHWRPRVGKERGGGGGWGREPESRRPKNYRNGQDNGGKSHYQVAEF